MTNMRQYIIWNWLRLRIKYIKDEDRQTDRKVKNIFELQVAYPLIAQLSSVELWYKVSSAKSWAY